MTVTIESQTIVGDDAVEVRWSSDLPAPQFFVYVDGKLLFATSLTSYIFVVPAGGSIHLEVLDEAGAIAGPAWPARAIVAWFAVPGAVKYRVEELLAAVWTVRDEIVDRGEGYYRVTTRSLEDVTTHQFRVVAIGATLNESVATSLTILTVRHPSTPHVTFDYDEGTTEVLIDAA